MSHSHQRNTPTGVDRPRRRLIGFTLLAALLFAVVAVADTHTPIANANGNAVELRWIEWTDPATYPSSSNFGGFNYDYTSGANGTISALTGGSTVYVKLEGEVLDPADHNSSGFGIAGSAYWDNMAGTATGAAYVSVNVPTRPTNSDRIAVVGQTAPNGIANQTLTFYSDAAMTTTTSVTNVIMAISSLGQLSTLASWDFSEDFTILSDNAGMPLEYANNALLSGFTRSVVDGGTRLSGREGTGTIQFNGTYSSISWLVTAPEFYAQWNIGVTSAAPPVADLVASRTTVTGTSGAEITPVTFTSTVGGTPTYTIQSGTLPAGLSFSTTNGAITGTPTDPTATTAVVIAVNGSAWGTATQTVSFTFTAPQVFIAPPQITTPPTTIPPTTPPAPVPESDGVLPRPATGTGAATEDGIDTPVEVFVDNETDLVMRGQDFELRLNGDCEDGCTIATTAGGREIITLKERGAANVSGYGFMPDTPVYVWLFSEPTFLGELTVAADGTFTGQMPLIDIAPGEHTLQVNGTSFDGLPRTANLGVLVTAPPVATPATLPATGITTHHQWALLLLSLGALLAILSRRPRHNTPPA
jgi:hypothetical protein